MFGGIQLSSGQRVTFGDVLLVASAVIAFGTLCGLAWRKVISPVRAAARQAFAHSVAEASRVSIEAAIAPTITQVADLHTRLTGHLADEARETASIHEQVKRGADAVEQLGEEMRATFDQRSAEFEAGVRPWRVRFEALEASHADILKALDGLSVGQAGLAEGQANVIHAVGGDGT